MYCLYSTQCINLFLSDTRYHQRLSLLLYRASLNLRLDKSDEVDPLDIVTKYIFYFCLKWDLLLCYTLMNISISIGSFHIHLLFTRVYSSCFEVSSKLPNKRACQINVCVSRSHIGQIIVCYPQASGVKGPLTPMRLGKMNWRTYIHDYEVFQNSVINYGADPNQLENHQNLLRDKVSAYLIISVFSTYRKRYTPLPLLDVPNKTERETKRRDLSSSTAVHLEKTSC